MSADIRVTLTDEKTAKLDAIRGPATRTAYAAHLLGSALERAFTQAVREAQADAVQDGEQK